MNQAQQVSILIYALGNRIREVRSQCRNITFQIDIDRQALSAPCCNLFFLPVQRIHRNWNSFNVYVSKRGVSGSSIHFDSEVQAGS